MAYEIKAYRTPGRAFENCSGVISRPACVNVSIWRIMPPMNLSWCRTDERRSEWEIWERVRCELWRVRYGRPVDSDRRSPVDRACIPPILYLTKNARRGGRQSGARETPRTSSTAPVGLPRCRSFAVGCVYTPRGFVHSAHAAAPWRGVSQVINHHADPTLRTVVILAIRLIIVQWVEQRQSVTVDVLKFNYTMLKRYRNFTFCQNCSK